MLFSSYLFGAEHCIQVTSVNRFNPEHINPRYMDIFDNFDKARIDKRGRRLVLRVGAYPNASSARRDLRRIRREFRGAFIRRCDYDPTKAVYPVFEDRVEEKPMAKKQVQPEEEQPNINIPNKAVVNDVKDEVVMDVAQNDIEEVDNEPLASDQTDVTVDQKPIEQAPQKPFKYKKQKKYNYQFWNECQKCFAPISNEASGNYVEPKETDDNAMDDEDMNNQDMAADENIDENQVVDTKDAIVEPTNKPLKRRDEEKTKKESKGWFSSLFSFSSDDDADDTDDDADIEMDSEDDGDVYSDTADSNDDTNNDNIFGEDQNDIKEPVAQNTDVVEEKSSYYDKN